MLASTTQRTVTNETAAGQKPPGGSDGGGGGLPFPLEELPEGQNVAPLVDEGSNLGAPGNRFANVYSKDARFTGHIIMAHPDGLGTVDGRNIAADGDKLDTFNQILTENIDQPLLTTSDPTFNNLTLTGMFDGRSVSADGTKLDELKTHVDASIDQELLETSDVNFNTVNGRDVTADGAALDLIPTNYMTLAGNQNVTGIKKFDTSLLGGAAGTTTLGNIASPFHRVYLAHPPDAEAEDPPRSGMIRLGHGLLGASTSAALYINAHGDQSTEVALGQNGVSTANVLWSMSARNIASELGDLRFYRGAKTTGSGYESFLEFAALGDAIKPGPNRAGKISLGTDALRFLDLNLNGNIYMKAGARVAGRDIAADGAYLDTLAGGGAGGVSNLVTLSSTQTISGSKTFTRPIEFFNAGGATPLGRRRIDLNSAISTSDHWFYGLAHDPGALVFQVTENGSFLFKSSHLTGTSSKAILDITSNAENKIIPGADSPNMDIGSSFEGRQFRDLYLKGTLRYAQGAGRKKIDLYSGASGGNDHNFYGMALDADSTVIQCPAAAQRIAFKVGNAGGTTSTTLLTIDGYGSSVTPGTDAKTNLGSSGSKFKDLHLSGNISMSVGGTVDGRDVSADGSVLDGLVATMPPAATQTTSVLNYAGVNGSNFWLDGQGREIQWHVYRSGDLVMLSMISTHAAALPKTEVHFTFSSALSSAYRPRYAQIAPIKGIYDAYDQSSIITVSTAGIIALKPEFKPYYNTAEGGVVIRPFTITYLAAENPS